MPADYPHRYQIDGKELWQGTCRGSGFRTKLHPSEKAAEDELVWLEKAWSNQKKLWQRFFDEKDEQVWREFAIKSYLQMAKFKDAGMYLVKIQSEIFEETGLTVFLRCGDGYDNAIAIFDGFESDGEKPNLVKVMDHDFNSCFEFVTNYRKGFSFG